MSGDPDCGGSVKSRVWPGVKAFDDLQTIEDMKSPMVTGTGKEGKCSRTYMAVSIYSRQIRLDFSGKRQSFRDAGCGGAGDS